MALLKITLPWTNYNGPLGVINFINSEAVIEGTEHDPVCTKLNVILPGIKYETVKAGGKRQEPPAPPAPKPIPKPMPKPLANKPIPSTKVEAEDEDSGVEAEDDEDDAIGDENEDPGDMMASDRLPPSTPTNPTPAEVEEAKARLKKLGLTGKNVLGPRLPAKTAKTPAKKGKAKK